MVRSNSDGGPDPQTSTEEVEASSAARLESQVFGSALSPAGLGACLELGMKPVGFVQGFAAMQINSSAFGIGGFLNTAAPTSSYQCPHGMIMGSNDHRAWGANYELSSSEAAWRQGFNSAYTRMIEEAKEAGAHGIIGVSPIKPRRMDNDAYEFHLYGTAVKVEGAQSQGPPFSTFLSGQRLVKLIQAGFMPVQVLSTISMVAIYASCITEGMETGWGGAARMGLGGYSQYGQGTGTMGEVVQVVDAHELAYRSANSDIQGGLAGDVLHGASVKIWDNHMSECDRVVYCSVQGTRVRRFKESGEIETPRVIVSLWR